MTAPVAIGIDLGGTNINVAIVDRMGQIFNVRSQPTPADRSVDSVINGIDHLVKDLIQNSSVEFSDLQGAGIGAPGPLSIKEGKILRSVNFPEFQNVPLRSLLKEKLNLPVVLDNDGNTAAYGEYWTAKVTETELEHSVEHLVMLTLGTGVGAGVILSGHIVHGHFDNAAELGHMIVVDDGLPCSCGQRGCLEQYASATGIVQRIASAIQTGESCVLSAAGSKVSIDAADVSEAAQKGDVLCQRIWDEACYYLAIACINIQHAYNPARIVLGGGMSNAGSFLLDRVIHNIQQHKWSLHDDVPEIMLTTLGDNAGVIGAAGLVWMES